MSDEAGWNLMESGGGAAARSRRSTRRGADPVGYAPTAVTGFAIGYVIDRPDNPASTTELRLNARLVAKLLTLSYPGSDLGRGHPGMADNPWGSWPTPSSRSSTRGSARPPRRPGRRCCRCRTPPTSSSS